MRNLISVVCVLVLFTLQTFAQQDSCNDPNCRTGSLIVNTGYDHTTNARFPTGQQDPYWILTAAPTNNGPVNLNGPANVIPSVWGGSNTIDNQSRYISDFNAAGANAANITGVPYRFERCFCVCDDNNVSVNVNYNLIAHYPVLILIYRPATTLRRLG